MEVIEPTQLIMRIATVYKHHITKWKGIFKGLIIKEAPSIPKLKNKP